MSTPISNKEQREKCKRFILVDPSREDLDEVIQDALITSVREICDIGQEPMAWNREQYDEIFTRYYAEISAITAADPGVITADSVDPDLTSDHGFQTNDIVFIDGVNGTNSRHRLNYRLFRAVRASATTITLKTMDGQDAIDTSGYEAYSSGGKIYHAGIILPRSTIEPTGGTASYEWNIKRVYNIAVDQLPCHPISEARAREKMIDQPGARPVRWRYQQYAYADFAVASVDHVVFWYPYVSQRYNINVKIEKEYPDLSVWTTAIYPPIPAHLHNYVWHRALANLATHGDSSRRRSAGKAGETGDNTKIEVANASYWIAKAAAEEREILNYSRKLQGDQPYVSQGMSA